MEPEGVFGAPDGMKLSELHCFDYFCSEGTYHEPCT